MQAPHLPALAFILLSTSLSLLSGCQPKQSQALGTLERDRVLLKSTAAELIVQVPVQKGQTVKAGDLLIQLDTSRQQIVLAKAIALRDGAEATLRKYENGARREEVAAQTALWNQTQIQSEEAQRQYQRARNLWEKRLISQAEFDKAKTAFNSSKADQERAHQSLLVLTRGTRPEDLAQARAVLDQTQNQVLIETRLLEDLSIRATRDAQLDDLPKHLGERALSGDVLAILLADATPYARVYIPEAVRVKVTSGTALRVHVDGVDSSFDGKVRWVSQDPAFTPYYALNSSDRSRLVYLAEIDLPSSAKSLPNGVPVQVDLPE